MGSIFEDTSDECNVIGAHTHRIIHINTLIVITYTEIEDVTTETLRKSKVQHRGQVC